MKYLLTVQSQNKHNMNTYMFNAVTEYSPEIWLAKKYLEESDYTLVLLNSIYIEYPNSIAMRKISENTSEIIIKDKT